MFHFLWRRRFVLLVTALGFVFALLVLTAILPLLPPDWIPPIAAPVVKLSASPALQAYATFLDLALLLAGVALAAYHFRHQRAAAFIERFNTPEVLEAREQIDLWLAEYEASPLRDRAQESPAELSDDEEFRLALMEARLLIALQRDPQLDKAVKSFANLFQELGEAYENRTASPSYTRRMFDHLAPHYWRLMRFWVEDYRLRKSPTLYKRFEILAAKLAESKRKTRSRKEEIVEEISDTSRLRQALLDRSQGKPRMFVFGYGSLVYSRSRDPVKPRAEIIRGRLPGFTRAWNVTTPVRMVDDGEGRERAAVFLDLVLSVRGECNGILMEVDDAELEFLDKREENYVQVDVTPWIEAADELPPTAVVYTYVGRAEHLVSAVEGAELYLLEDYVRLLDQGLREHPSEFREDFWAHTRRPAANIRRIEGKYQFLDEARNRASGRDRPEGP